MPPTLCPNPTHTQVLETFDTAIEAALHVARFMGPHASAAAAVGEAEMSAADVKAAAAAAAAAAHSAARKKQRVVAEESACLRAAEERSLARLKSERNDDDVYAAHLLLGMPMPST